jgi:serine/threonine protein kinase
MSNGARYRECSTLGVGGMATVTLAEDTLLGRKVAMKRLPAGAGQQGLERLRREALLGASINHPNVVSIYDVLAGEDGETVIVMEYVDGETLRERLRRRGRLPIAEAMVILEQLAAGLDAIHARGVVHRDIKPANILLGRDGAVKLADLGIASAPDRTRITTVGSVIGSFGYMAPEQFEDGRVTPAIDVYALAAVAFEALSGRSAHTETNPIAAAHAIVHGPPPDLRDAWPSAPPAAAAVIARAMARDPASRPASAGELVSSLHRAFEPATAPTQRVTPIPRRRPESISWLVAPVLLSAVLLVLVLALLGGGTGGAHASRTAARTPARTAPAARTAPPASAPAPAAAAPAPPAGPPPGHRKHHDHGKHH